MKITANRLDDLLKQREKYDADMQVYEDRETASLDKYREAFYIATKDVEKKVAELIGSTPLSLEIRVDSNYSRGVDNTWKVHVAVDQRNNFNENTALVWDFDISLDKDGNVVKDSSSWSGLKAVTPEQISDLEESVRILKLLNNIDWSGVLRSPQPNLHDFHDEEAAETFRSMRKARPDFESDILNAQIEEIIEDGETAIPLSKDEYFRGTVYILPTKMTDKFITGYIFPPSYLNMTIDEIKQRVGERRTSKSNLVKISSDELSTIKVNK